MVVTDRTLAIAGVPWSLGKLGSRGCRRRPTRHRGAGGGHASEPGQGHRALRLSPPAVPQRGRRRWLP